MCLVVTPLASNSSLTSNPKCWTLYCYTLLSSLCSALARSAVGTLEAAKIGFKQTLIILILGSINDYLFDSLIIFVIKIIILQLGFL